MTLILRNDTSNPGGGFALLGGPGLSGVASLTIENCFSGQFLGEDGKWGRNPFAFPVEDGPSGMLLLGPHIVDHVPTELQVELRSGDGKALGKLFWEGAIPSRNPGSVTSAQVLEERRRRAEQRVTEEKAAGARIAAQKAAQEEADRERADEEAAARLARSEAAERDRAAAAADRSAAFVAETTIVQQPVSAPRRRRRSPWILALLMLLLAAAAAVLVARPDLLERVRAPAGPATTETPPPQQPSRPEPVAEPKPAPSPEASPAPPPPARVDCSAFSGRVSDLQGHPDADKVALGEEALRAGCGAEAFQAFDSSDPQTSEAAAWNLARFYDPNEENPIYRRTASIHPDFAAAYYKLWRNRSPRQAAALAKICQAEQGGGTSLRQSCGR